VKIEASLETPSPWHHNFVLIRVYIFEGLWDLLREYVSLVRGGIQLL
jgi:hypothetical protein